MLFASWKVCIVKKIVNAACGHRPRVVFFKLEVTLIHFTGRQHTMSTLLGLWSKIRKSVLRQEPVILQELLPCPLGKKLIYITLQINLHSIGPDAKRVWA